MRIRPYRSSDKPACLEVFESNVPRFFAPHEQTEFAAFLDSLPAPGPYLVVEAAPGAILGCGGYFFKRDQSTAGLMWGMVHAARHRQGIGRALLLARLYAICQQQQARLVELDTSQHSRGFFATVGFQTLQVHPDFYAPGLDRHDMRLVLTPERCAELERLYQQQAWAGAPA